jgi:regulator of replication initiation timing
MNEHRKIIFDKFYQWVENNIDSLPQEVTDVTAEIWNLEEECELLKRAYVKLRDKKVNNSNIHFNH